MNNPYGLGAERSHDDPRTLSHEVSLAAPLVVGGIKYQATDMDNQHRVGICTAISLTQWAGKAKGKDYSPDFQYLLQKKFYDGGWWEGSSIFVALKVGKKYGFLEEKDFRDPAGNEYVTENDRSLPYGDYAAKLMAIPDGEIVRLLALCADKLTGYERVDTSSPQFIAKAIQDSKYGILCRYSIGEEWWTPSSKTKDIDPIRPPVFVISGHAIIASYFDFSNSKMFYHPNTWGIYWDDELFGNCNIDWNQYKMTEAWIPSFEPMPPVPPFTHYFDFDLRYGNRSKDVEALQIALQKEDVFPKNQSITGFYGIITENAVKAFQRKYGIVSWGTPWLTGYGRVGPKTRAKLNEIFNN